MSRYRLFQNTNVPYTTLNDICRGKTSLEKCSAETVYRLAKGLDVSMEELLAPLVEERCSFELFKSNVCHKLKNLGDIDFLIETLEKDEIHLYYERRWYAESLYLLAMVDYVSRVNDIPLCDDYKELRKQKLTEPLYPAGILALAAASEDEEPKKRALREAIPEFMQFNIVESEVRIVTGEYLIAMKLRAGRKYKNDFSDIVGILAEHEQKGQPISYGMIDDAVKTLYGSWKNFSKDSLLLLQNIFDSGNYASVYMKIRQGEKQAREVLLDFQEDYPGILKEENLDDVLENRMNQENKRSILSLLQEVKAQK